MSFMPLNFQPLQKMETRSQKRRRRASLNLTQGTEGQIKAMEKALHISLIVEEIVNSMDLPQLIISRQLNQNWNCMSSQVIKKFYCMNIVDSYMNAVENKVKALDTILKTSTNFPSSSCYLYVSFNARLPRKVETFFAHHGSKIKRFFLMSVIDASQNEIIGQILSRVAPTLERLDLFVFELNLTASLEFPHLKHFNSDSPSAMLHILKMASNLETIDTMRVSAEILNGIAQFGKLALIKEGQTAELLEVFSICESLKLEKLEVEDSNDFETRTRIEQILEWSKNSLRHLKLRKAFYPGFRIPKLANLKILELYPENTRPSNLLGYERDIRRINLTETFPNIQVLHFINYGSAQDEDWNFLLSPNFYSGNFPTVKKIKMSTFHTESWISHLLLLCPNFTQLEISSGINRIPDLARVFKMWSQLTELKLIDVEISSQNFCLDSILTGLSKETCERLRSMNSEEREDNWEKLITGPSLWDLKRLKRLTIKLRVSSVLPFSRVSGIYSFKLMPHLTISLILGNTAIGIKTWMEELGSFVNIQQ